MNWTDIEIIATFCLEAVSSLSLELICVAVFLGGWLLGKWGSKTQKTHLRKTKLKHFSCDGGEASAGLTRTHKPSEKVGRELRALCGRIDSINPKLLKDPSWVVPKLTQLGEAQFPEALPLYRAAVKAGFQLPDVAAEDSRQLFVGLVTTAVRTGKTDEAQELLSDLRRIGLSMSMSLVSSVVKLCTSKQLFAECLVLFDFMNEEPGLVSTDKSIWSCLLFCATEAKAYKRSVQFFDRLKACGMPTSKDFGNMCRMCALQGDWARSLSLIAEMRKDGIEIESMQYNTTLATCVAASKLDQACALLDSMEGVNAVADVITYNTICKGYAKAGQIDKCFELVEHMRAKGISASQVTYGILLDCCINEKHVDRAMHVYNEMKAAGCEMNTVLYTTLIKGFARAGDLEKALDMYTQMKAEPDISPDLITFSVLIKANCDNDHLEDALELLGEMVSIGLRPDEVVFNNLMAGCARQGNAKLGKQLYEDMVKSGMRPSTATFSILIRLYHQSKLLEDAVTLLKTEPAKHNVEPEERLFVQLIQSCIRERQGRRAIEVYGMLSEHSTPNATAHSGMLGTCMRLNMYDTAVEILSMAVANGGRVDACDTSALLEAAVRKGKIQAARNCIASMHSLYHTVDRKCIDFVEKNTLPAQVASGHSRGPCPSSVPPWKIGGGRVAVA